MKRPYGRLSIENIKSRVDVDGNGCWIWNRAIRQHKKNCFDYGWVTFNAKQMTASRASWIIHFGEIPAGMCVCHKCDVPKCVNPDHLFLGTHSENMKDMWVKRRHPPTNAGIEGSRSSKLKLTDIREIRELLKRGIRQKTIGEMFGVHENTISKIKCGTNWGSYV